MLKKTFSFLFFLFIPFLFASCSFGFLCSKKQKVEIIKDSLATIKIDDKMPVMKKNKYILARDAEARQITITRQGYKTQYAVCVPNKLSWSGYATIGFNAAIIAIPATSFFIATGASGLASVGIAVLGGTVGAGHGYLKFKPKFYKYPKIVCKSEKMIAIPHKDSISKEILLNKFSVDLNKELVEDYYLSESKYRKEKINKKSNVKYENGLKLDETFYSDLLNDILSKNGFVDTSGFALRTNYNQNAYLNATIIGYKWINVPSRYTVNQKNGYINVELKVKWDVLDYYKNTIYTDTVCGKSGEFVSYTKDVDSDFKDNAVKDALETSLYTLMDKPNFKSTIKLSTINTLDTLKNIEISSPDEIVTNIEQAVQAAVTIKTDKGHASGFFISGDGYIVTNYHAIKDTSKLEIILNDGSKHFPKVIRFNKETDLALLKINAQKTIAFELSDSNQALMGDEIYVIGTPSAEDLSQSLTKGIISSIRKQANGLKLIQTDASISRGNSGGPLIDNNGKLLGIVNAKLVGIGIEGIAFAIPQSEIIRSLAIKLK